MKGQGDGMAGGMGGQYHLPCAINKGAEIS